MGFAWEESMRKGRQPEALRIVALIKDTERRLRKLDEAIKNMGPPPMVPSKQVLRKLTGKPVGGA